MSKRVRSFSFILLIAFFSASFAADSKTRARHLLEEYLSISHIPGMSVAVCIDGEMVYKESFGMLDLENQIKATPETRFRLGSVSKIFTIAALARIYERGLIDLDAPIGKYLKEIPDEYKAITSRQLAGHLGGVRHYLQKDFDNDTRSYKTVKESLRIFTGDPLLHAPGRKYLYSTYGYVLLSAVMEAASGKDFLQLLQDEVIAPLQLENSGPDFVREITPGRTRYYERNAEKIRHAGYEDPSYKWAAAGVISTASDLVKFGTAHLKGDYLKPETLQMLFTSLTTPDEKPTGVGIGWRIGTDWAGRRIYHHAGNISGGRSVLILYPDQELVISIVSNLSGEPALIERTAQIISHHFMPGEEYNQASVEIAGEYVIQGSFQEKPYDAKLRIVSKEGNFMGELTGGFPMLEIAKKNGLPVKISIADVFTNHGKTTMVLATPFGLVDLGLVPDTGQYTFVLDAGPAKIEGRMTHQ